MQFQYLGRDDPLEEGMATHSSSLAQRIPWSEEPGGTQLDMTEVTQHARVMLYTFWDIIENSDLIL